jgi:hypothetical protein
MGLYDSTSVTIEEGTVPKYIFKPHRILNSYLMKLRRIWWSKPAQAIGAQSETLDKWLSRSMAAYSVRRLTTDQRFAQVNKTLAGPTRLACKRGSLTAMPDTEIKLISSALSEGQGLGNQLWAYAVTRATAQRLGAPFAILGEHHFKGAGFLSIDFGEFIQASRSSEVRTSSGQRPIIREKVSRTPDGLDISKHDASITSFGTGAHLEGNFQSFNYIQDHQSEIRTWISATTPSPPLPEELVVIHFRGGDFRGNPHFLSRTYYDAAIECATADLNNAKFLIVSDEPKFAEEYLGIKSTKLTLQLEQSKLRKAAPALAPHHKGRGLAQDFTIMTAAKRLIIPNSSLSWWAAFLSLQTKEVVVAPKYWAGHNARPPIWSTAEIETPGFTYISPTN